MAVTTTIGKPTETRSTPWKWRTVAMVRIGDVAPTMMSAIPTPVTPQKIEFTISKNSSAFTFLTSVNCEFTPACN